MTTNERIRAYLEAIPPCIAGQGGDVHLFKVACVLFNGWALSEEQNLEWLRVFNMRCQPPWDEYRLAYKARAAANASYEKPRGYLLDGASIVKPIVLRNQKRCDTPIMSSKVRATDVTDTTAKSKLSRIVYTVSLEPSRESRPSRNRLKSDVVSVAYLQAATDATAKSEKSGAKDQWKVPDPPPGLNWAERQKFYMDDLRDAIGDEWITPTWFAPPWSS